MWRAAPETAYMVVTRGKFASFATGQDRSVRDMLATYCDETGMAQRDDNKALPAGTSASVVGGWLHATVDAIPSVELGYPVW
jgi:hypothetical protein